MARTARHDTVLAAALEALRGDGDIDAVYSAGGGNDAILAAFAEVGRSPRAFVAHDLDTDNRRLLRAHRVSAVLHHDLRGDLRRACRVLLQASGRVPGAPTARPVADPGRDAVQRAGRPRRRAGRRL